MFCDMEITPLANGMWRQPRSWQGYPWVNRTRDWRPRLVAAAKL